LQAQRVLQSNQQTEKIFTQIDTNLQHFLVALMQSPTRFFNKGGSKEASLIDLRPKSELFFQISLSTYFGLKYLKLECRIIRNAQTKQI
jgi:hypothetical protein